MFVPCLAKERRTKRLERLRHPYRIITVSLGFQAHLEPDGEGRSSTSVGREDVCGKSISAALTRFSEGGETVKHRVAVIPGDGIGKEVVPEALRVLERAGEMWGFEFE